MYSTRVFCLTLVLFAPIANLRADESISRRIDAVIKQAHDGELAPRSTDAEFLRRISLDLTGSIPTAAEAKQFLDNKSPDKRSQLVSRMLDGKDFPRRMQQYFTVVLLERGTGATVAMEEWEEFLRSSFASNKPLDQLVREIVAADGTDPATRPAMKFYLARSATDHRLLARDISRLLLGRNLECAQCHDHPSIDGYKQAEFFGLVAFLNRSYLYRDKKTNLSYFLEKGIEPAVEFTSVFTTLTDKTGPRVVGGTAIEVPEFDKGQELQTPPAEGGLPLPKFPLRPVLAEQLTSSQQRAFAENLANRLWAMMMGRGLVHPLDMHHAGNPASHPALLQLLADELISQGYDVKKFLRAIALTETYQRSSRIGEAAAETKPQTFAAFNLKPLSAEQLALSVLRATGSEQRILATAADTAATAKYRPDKGHPIPAENLDNVLKLFRSIYAGQKGQPEDDFVPSIAAALFAENEALLLRWLTPEKGELIARLVKLKSTDAIAEELYLSVLTRRPTTEEREAVAEYVESAGDREAALREMAWALLASSEFRFNH